MLLAFPQQVDGALGAAQEEKTLPVFFTVQNITHAFVQNFRFLLLGFCKSASLLTQKIYPKEGQYFRQLPSMCQPSQIHFVNIFQTLCPDFAFQSPKGSAVCSLSLLQQQHKDITILHITITKTDTTSRELCPSSFCTLKQLKL